MTFPSIQAAVDYLAVCEAADLPVVVFVSTAIAANHTRRV